jgi:hypothetical protein
MKPKDYQEHGNPRSGQGYNYLYEIVGLENFNPLFKNVRMVKDGYAKEFYSTGHNGLFQRVRTTVREFEKAFAGGRFGALEAKVYGNICKTANRSLAQEQYLHKRNQNGDEWLLPLIQQAADEIGVSRPSGSTEFYNWSPKRAYGKYLQSMTKKAIGEGWDDIVSHNFKGQSGWRLPIVGRALS